jgi:hypothetical protein
MPEDNLFTGKRHGIFATEADAIHRAKKFQKPQGNFTPETQQFANDQVQANADKLEDGKYLAVPLPSEMKTYVVKPYLRLLMTSQTKITELSEQGR